MLDCLFVNPSALSQIYQKLSNDLTAIEPPIWAGLLANGVRSKGYSVEILDCEADNLTADEAAKVILAKSTKLIVIVVYGQQPSASTQNMYAAEALAKSIRMLDSYRTILFVGGHVSALPEKTLEDNSTCFLAKGEGLYTILGLLSGIKIDDINGLGFKTFGRTQINKRAQNIPQELLHIELPGVAWDLLPMNKYRAHNWHSFSNENHRGNYASIYTSLGCPYSCTFCCINAPFEGSSFRFWKPDFTLSQLELLSDKYGVENIKIADEMFVLKESHYMSIVQGIIDRKLDLNIWAYARIDTVKPLALDRMKKAGINWLALGIESGSHLVRSGVNKSRFVDKDIEATVYACKAAGINVIGNYIFGLPNDTYETMNETLELAEKLNCEMSNFYSAMAYPGSKLYETAVINKWELPKTWLGYSQHAKESLPLRTEHLTSGQVLGFRDYAFNRFFKGDRYLDMVKQKFGDNTFKGIKQMARLKLSRDNAVEYVAK